MQNQEILIAIILGILLALLLIAFVVTILFLYQKRQQQHTIELATMQEEYDQQILRVQFEMHEATLAEISHKLHDALKNNINGIANDIAGIRMKMEKKLIADKDVFEEMIRFEKTLIIVRDEIRLTSHSLSHDKLEKVGLLDTIKFEANRLQRNNSALTVIADVKENDIYNFTQEQSVYLFRIFQEIIANVLAHSKASNLHININYHPANVFLLEIKDNGIGFNVAEKKKSKLSGIGLSGIQKRCLQIGADLQIISSPNSGTTIKIQLLLTEQIKNTKNVAEKNEAKYSFD